MDAIKTLTEILFKYGPFAICAFMFLAIMWLFTRDRWNTLSAGTKKNLLITTEVLIFIVIAIWVALQFFAKPEYVINGTFEYVGAHEKILSGQLYLKRNYIGDPRYFDYDWKIVTHEKMKPGEKIKFCYDKSTAEEEENVCFYALSFDPRFYKELVRIEYDREYEKMYWRWDDDNGKELEKITASKGNIREKTTPFSTAPFSGILFAQDLQATQIQPRFLTGREKELIRSHLTSRDILIRRRARKKLSQHGTKNVDFLNELLNSESFWLELGILEAIRYMEQRHIQEIWFALDRPRIQVLAESPNLTLKKSATNVLRLLRLWKSKEEFLAVETASGAGLQD